MFKRQVLIECISALLIVLFVYASLSKYLNLKDFRDELNNQPFPNSWTPWLIGIIPASELLISAALLFERTRLAGFYAFLLLMSTFAAYSIFILLNFFEYIPCSCGGVIRQLTWPQHLVFCLFFMGLSFCGIILQRRKYFKSIIFTKNSFV